MSQQPEIQVTDQDMQSLADKLNTFQETLSPAEQAILENDFPPPEGEDVQGYVVLYHGRRQIVFGQTPSLPPGAGVRWSGVGIPRRQ